MEALKNYFGVNAPQKRFVYNERRSYDANEDGNFCKIKIWSQAQ